MHPFDVAKELTAAPGRSKRIATKRNAALCLYLYVNIYLHRHKLYLQRRIIYDMQEDLETCSIRNPPTALK